MTPYTSFLADETVKLHAVAELRDRGRLQAGGLRVVRGVNGQMAAKTRQMLRAGRAAPAPTAPGSGGRMYGYADV